MAIAGRYGTLELKREWAAPTAVSTGAITGDAITLENQCFWRGDRILLMSQRGMPILLDGEAYARCPDGYSFYNDGVFDTGPGVAARTVGDQFYAASDSAAFYETDLVKDDRQYCHMSRNEMDDVQFYQKEEESWAGEAINRYDVANIDFGSLLFVPSPSGTFDNSLVTKGIENLPPDIADNGEITVEEFWPDDVRNNVRELINDQSRASDWERVTSLTGWIFEMNAGVLDQSAIGDKFGEHVKGLLQGAGSLEGVMDCSEEGQNLDSSALLKYALMTEEGSKAKARFTIATTQARCVNDGGAGTRSPAMQYLADILVSNSAINITTDDLIRVNIEFIATGTCKLGTVS